MLQTMHNVNVQDIVIHQMSFNPGSNGVKVIYSWSKGKNKGLRVVSKERIHGVTLLLSLTSPVKQRMVEPQAVR